jgi:Uma2 family endonuclease
MGVPLKKVETRFNYGDYLKWPEEERWEIISGEAYNMTPAPSTHHQRVSRRLLTIFENFLKDKKCEVFGAPYDVILPENNESEKSASTVVQPDIAVICDKFKIKTHGCVGAPDLIIEILSPATSKKDMTVKFELYEYHKVKQYWLVHPKDKYAMVFKLDSKTNRYGRPDIYLQKAKIKVGILKDLVINLDDVFKE